MPPEPGGRQRSGAAREGFSSASSEGVLGDPVIRSCIACGSGGLLAAVN